MRADDYTKSFTDAVKWTHAAQIASIPKMAEFKELALEMNDVFRDKPCGPHEPRTEEQAHAAEE